MSRSAVPATVDRLWATGTAAALAPGDPPLDWFPGTYAAFASRLADADGYPCHFGVRGQRRGHNWFTVLDRRLPDSYGVDALAASLVEFRHRAWVGPPRQSLVGFVGPPAGPGPSELAADHARFWRLLAALSARDPAPWPATVPSDPADPAWQWCFAGEPWFVFACSPGHRARRSRNLGPCLTVIWQTMRVFQGIGGSTTAGQAAKRQIRERLVRYDAVAPHPHLGDPRRSSVHKWRQYALPDDDTVRDVRTCPFRKEELDGGA